MKNQDQQHADHIFTSNGNTCNKARVLPRTCPKYLTHTQTQPNHPLTTRTHTLCNGTTHSHPPLSHQNLECAEVIILLSWAASSSCICSFGNEGRCRVPYQSPLDVLKERVVLDVLSTSLRPQPLCWIANQQLGNQILQDQGQLSSFNMPCQFTNNDSILIMLHS